MAPHTIEMFFLMAEVSLSWPATSIIAAKDHDYAGAMFQNLRCLLASWKPSGFESFAPSPPVARSA